MRTRLVAALMIAVPCAPLLAEREDLKSMLAELEGETAALREEEQMVNRQITLLEEKYRIQEEHANLLLERLEAMGRPSDLTPSSTLGTQSDTDAEDSENTEQRQNELLSECSDRIAILRTKHGNTATAFLMRHEGKPRIFASAPWAAENTDFSATDIHGQPIAFGNDFTTPAGVGLLALHPENTGLPNFDPVDKSEILSVGTRVMVVVVDPESRGLSGVGGAVRGMGPDTLELDADLTPEMAGSPVLSIGSGKVIGVVAEQVGGVAEDWAVGTRHEASRHFAIRLDNISGWEKSDRARFAKEAAFLRKLQHRNRIASIAYRLLESERSLATDYASDNLSHIPGIRPGESYAEYNARIAELRKDFDRILRERNKGMARLRERIQAATKEAESYQSDPHITRVMAWQKERKSVVTYEIGGPLDRSMAFIYRSMLIDLSGKDPDPSAHLGAYHLKQYKAAIAHRDEAVRAIKQQVDKIAR